MAWPPTTHQDVQDAVTNLRGRKAVAVYDDFTASSDAASIAGRTPTVGSTWQVTGAQGVGISSARATSTGVGYAWQTLADPIGGAVAEVTFTGDPTQNQMTVAFTSGSTLDLNNLAAHFNFGPKGFALTVRKDGGSFDQILSGQWVRQIPTDGTTIARLSLSIRGTTVLVVGPNGEPFAVTDPRVAALLGTVVFWEPNNGGTAAAQLARVGAYTQAAAGQYGQADLFDFSTGGAVTLGPNGQTVGNKEQLAQVMIGQDPGTGQPSVIFGPTTVRTVLAAALTAGGTTLTAENQIPNGSTVILESGTNAETVTVTAPPSGSGPYTHTITAATKTHAARIAVVASPSTGTRSMYYNPSNSFFFLPDTVNVVPGGNFYFGGGLDTSISRPASDLLAMGSGDSFQVDGAWNGGTLRLGGYRLWIDSSGRLRVMNGAPSSDTDGTVVGSQA